MPQHDKNNRSVAVIGMGCVSAAGGNTIEHQKSLDRRTRNCHRVPEWLFPTRFRYPVFFGPQEPLSAGAKRVLADCGREGETPSRTNSLLLTALAEALIMAGLSPFNLQKKRVGIAIGTTVGCAFNHVDYYQAFREKSRPAVNPIINYFDCNLAYWLQSLLQLSGPSLVVTNACASGTDAIGIAGNWIESGLCDLAIAGGADALSQIAYNGFMSLKLMSEAPCCPFDEDREGLNLGEGAGIVLLTGEMDAKVSDGNPIGWLRGYGVSSDAWHPTAPHPEGEGMVRAINLAKARAGSGLQLNLINAHGTATKANDSAETNALASVFAKGDLVPIVSTKGITGHTLGAAGGIEAILTLMSLQAGKVSGTIGCGSVDPGLKIKPMAQSQTSTLNGNMGMSQSLAFGGGNSAIILEAN